MRQRYRRLRKSGPMIKVPVPVMANDGAGYHTEHLAMGYSPYRGCVWAAVKPSWSKFWAVVHTDTGYILRRTIKTADQAKVVVGRMDKYWHNCSWETLLEHNSQVQTDLYYERPEYVYRNAYDSNLYLGSSGWGSRDQATVWSEESKKLAEGKMMPGEWELI